MDTAHHSSTPPPPPLSEYPGIPGILGRSQDHPGMDTAHHPPCLSILGFLGYSDDPGIIPGWTQLTTPLSEYPGIPGILRQGGGGGGMSCVHPGMIPGSFEYPRNPRILRQGGVSCVHPWMIPGSTEYPRNPRILRQGGRAVSIHPGMILGSSEFPRNPRILRQRGGGGDVRPSQDDPRIVRVSQESQDTQTGGGVSCVHPGMIPGSSEYPRNPRILRQGGVSCVHPWMIPGSSEYPRNPRILRQGGKSCVHPSRDDPGIVRVSQESQVTQTGGGVRCVHPRMIPGSSEYPRNPRILR